MTQRRGEHGYCPYCGVVVSGGSKFCPSCGASIRHRDWQVEVSGHDAREVEQVAQALVSSMSSKKDVHVQGPWLSGSFYLATMIVVVTVLLVAAKTVSSWILPIVIVGAILAVSVVGAFQLRQDARLTEKNFLALVLLVFKQIPFLRKSHEDKNAEH